MKKLNQKLAILFNIFIISVYILAINIATSSEFINDGLFIITNPLIFIIILILINYFIFARENWILCIFLNLIYGLYSWFFVNLVYPYITTVFKYSMYLSSKIPDISNYSVLNFPLFFPYFIIMLILTLIIFMILVNKTIGVSKLFIKRNKILFLTTNALIAFSFILLIFVIIR